MASVSQYNRGAGNRSIVVCGGFGDGYRTASCEELPIDARGLPAASSWRSFASLPFTLMDGCMLQVNGAVRVCSLSFFNCHSLLQLYHIGGWDLGSVNRVYVYDETSGRWQPAAPLPQALYLHGCAVLHCQGLVCGGFTYNNVLSMPFFQH